MKKDRQPLSLRKVVAACPSALAVFRALEEVAGADKSLRITPTRADLAALTGISFETISKALGILKSARWISLTHVPVHVGAIQTATLLRITIIQASPIGGIFRTPIGRAEKCRSTTTTPVERKNAASPPSGRAEKCRSLSYREGHSAAPLSAGVPEPLENNNAIAPIITQPLDLTFLKKLRERTASGA